MAGSKTAFFMPTLPATVIILDDHPLVAQGLAHYYRSVRADIEVLTVMSCSELQRMIDTKGPPQLVVADVWLECGNILEDLERFRQRYPVTPWLAISGDDDPLITQRMRNAGAHGFVHKKAPPETFAAALTALLQGGEWFEPVRPSAVPAQAMHTWTVTAQELGLTPRQGEILDLVLHGLPNKRIALALHLSESTVKEHVTGILDKLGVRNRVEAITKLRGRRLLAPLASAITSKKESVY
jgi:DNA-binding NarL/FixJ family response regulator